MSAEQRRQLQERQTQLQAELDANNRLLGVDPDLPKIKPEVKRQRFSNDDSSLFGDNDVQYMSENRPAKRRLPKEVIDLTNQ
jgi:hypothetical protein